MLRSEAIPLCLALSLPFACPRAALAQQGGEGEASTGIQVGGGDAAPVAAGSLGRYASRGVTLPEGRIRVDLAPPDYGYSDHGMLNDADGLRAIIPERGHASVGLGVGGAYGIMDELEAGALLFPLLFAPDFDFGDMEFYGRFAFVRGNTDLAAQITLQVPTATDFGMGVGIPVLFRPGGGCRLDTGFELEAVFAHDALINADLPFAVSFELGEVALLGGRTGLLIYDMDFELVYFNLGVQGGVTIDDSADLTASLNWPAFLRTGPGDAVNLDIIEIVLGANLYFDVLR